MHKILNPIKENIKNMLEPFATKKDITPAELENIKDALCVLSQIEDALDRDAEYSRMEEIYGRGDNSYRRGRDSMTGQYVSRGEYPYMGYSMGRRYPEMGYSYGMGDGYSNHGSKHEAIASLEKAMGEAKTESERAMYAGMIDDLRMNQ